MMYLLSVPAERIFLAGFRFGYFFHKTVGKPFAEDVSFFPSPYRPQI